MKACSVILKWVKPCLHLREQLAHFDLNRQFFAQFALQTLRQRLARFLLAAGELPQPAEQPVERALRDQHLAARVPDDPGGHVVMRCRRFRRLDRALVLRAVLIRRAVIRGSGTSAHSGARGLQISRPKSISA